MIENWGTIIKKHRLRQGLSQIHLAQWLGVSQRTVSRWERSEDQPSAVAQKRLRDLGLEPPPAMLSNLKMAITHCPVPRAISTKQSMCLLGVSKPAIEKRPSIVNFIGHDLIGLASGILLEMLDDRELQKAIACRDVACVIATTRSVLQTEESIHIGAYRTTISYFIQDGTMYEDAISVPVSPTAICGYQAVPVMHTVQH